MAGAAPAYKMYPSYAPARQPSRRPDISVIPGSRHPERERDAVQTLRTIALTVAIVSIIIAGFAFARIVLSSMTVNTALEAHQLSEQITEARSAGGTLEAQQASLSSSARIKAAASELNMVAPEENVVLFLGEDVVATDAEGNLSLAMSAQRATGVSA